VKKPKLLLAALVLLLGAASAAGRGLHASLPAATDHPGESVMLMFKKGRS
jgi:hypothetical protein